MKIAVTAKGAGLGAWIDPNFVDCKHFVIVDDNKQFVSWEPEVTIGQDIFLLAEKIIALNIDVLITGHLPADVEELFLSKGIKVFTAQEGSILELVEKYQTSWLSFFAAKFFICFNRFPNLDINLEIK